MDIMRSNEDEPICSLQYGPWLYFSTDLQEIM